jgi:L-2-hydroxyglutarate oxidase LhgO
MFDVVIIGAGIVGLAIARSIGETTNKSVLVIEKEASFGRGISSRNSEVIHSGIYYDPGSLKAKYCTRGRDMVYAFCEKNNIWYNRCGKLVVGTYNQSEELNTLYSNGQENDVPEIQIIDKKEINKLEPNIKADIALHVGCTGIISTHDLMAKFYKISQENDHDYLFKSQVIDVRQANNSYQLDIENAHGEIEKVISQWVINSAGLESDLVAHMLDKDFPRLRYSKGCYYKLSSKWRGAFKRLVYPLPDKKHGTLGIHLSFDETEMMRLGPGADWVDRKEENYDVEENLLDQFYSEGCQYITGLDKEDLSPDYAGIRPKIWIYKNLAWGFYLSIFWDEYRHSQVINLLYLNL